MKRVFGSYNQTLVHHARNLLEAARIEVHLRNQYLAGAMGELPPAECQMEIWVDERDVERAEEVLRTQPAAGADWSCACGESLGAQFTQCWSCGRQRPAAA